jgi:hypothetical protein
MLPSDDMSTNHYFSVRWTHPTLDNERCGADSEWPDREAAEFAAEAVRKGGGRDVRIVRFRR